MGNAVHIELTGSLRVHTGGCEVAVAGWARRPRELVALLALSPGHRLPRERIVELLWPHLEPDAGARNLRKAAHHARRALGLPDAVVLKGGQVELLPGHVVTTDVERFLTDADTALATGDAETCAAVAATAAGELLPDALYESWTQDPRRRLAERRAALLRRAGRHEALLELEPTDEAACAQLMREALNAGHRHVALRWYERLRLALARELGAAPGEEVRALYDRCTSGLRASARPLVGRELELARLTGELQRVGEAGTGAVLVRGPTGIGKSALCRELAARATDAGWRVLSAACVASGPPYGPLTSALEQLAPDADLARLPDRTRSVLGELVPAAAIAAPPTALTRHQVVAAVRRLLSASGPRPTLLLVEDAHLADEASADVLHQLVAGSGSGPPLLVVLALRSEWMRTSLPAGVRALAASGEVPTLTLEPLGDDEVAALVHEAAAEPPTREDVGRIVRTAEGSPFFSLELVRALGAAADTLPRTVREAIRTRFAALDDPADEALAVLAVAEDPFDLASVLALTGLPEAQAFDVLDALLGVGALVVAGTQYRFRHHLVRQVLVEELPPHRRATLHRDAAERLHQAGARPGLIGHHWLRGERPAEAVGFLFEAARRACAVGAYADALAELGKVVEIDPGHRDGLTLRAEALDAVGDPRAPEAYAAAARAVGPPADQELLARQALAQLKASDPASALRTLEGVTPRTTVGRLAEALTLSAAAAIGAYGDAATAAAKAEQAHGLALELGDPGAILDATWAHALAAHAQGELPKRLREYLRSTAALPDIATHVFDGQLCVTERILHGGLPNAEVIAFADALADEAGRLGAARGLAFAHTLRGEAAILAGLLDAADADFTEGARLHSALGAAAGEALSLLGRAQVAVMRGRPEHARPFLADALMLARESAVGHHTLDRIYGTMVEAAGNADAALAVVRDAESSIRGPAETCPTCRIAFLVPAAIATARAGDLDRAAGYVADVEVALDVVALPPAWHAAGHEVRGWHARASGEDATAREHFGQAADGFRAWDQPLDAERCRALVGG